MKQKKKLTCDNCSDCCKYIATQIDKPKDEHDYQNIIWFLHHQNVGVYIGWDNHWYLEFITKCKNLSPKGLCKIYAKRPQMCQDYKQSDCTNFNDEPAEKIYFKTAEDFEKYLENKKLSLRKKIK